MMMLRKAATGKTRLLDTLVAVALLGVTAYFLHFRSHQSAYGTADALTVAVLIGTALAIGWRDRVPVVVDGAAKLLGRSRGPQP